MTTDEKKQALADAGIKLRANASEETILAAWDEFTKNSHADEPGEDGAAGEDGIPDDAATFGQDGEIITHGVIYEDGKSIGVTGPVGPPGDYAAYTTTLNPPVASNKKATRSQFEEVVIRLGTKQLGDRTPEVVAWARENLSDDEFEARYGGRNLDV